MVGARPEPPEPVQAGSWGRRFLLGALVAILLGSAAVAVHYRSWLADAVERLEAGSQVLETKAGPVEVARAGDRGPTVLLVHGTPGGYDQTLPMAERFERAGFRVLAVSRPGYLRTPLDVGHSPAEQADAHAALLDALGLERVAIVGISGGGPSALEFAIRHAARCWALVDFMGVSRAANDDELGPARELEGSWVARLLASDFGGYALARLLRAFPDRVVDLVLPDPANAARVRADPAAHEALLAMLEGSLTLASRRDPGTRNDMARFAEMGIPDLGVIRVPTLILHGTSDVNVPMAMAELVADRVSGAELVTVDGGDHAMVFSHPDEVYGPMLAFLEGHAPRRSAP